MTDSLLSLYLIVGGHFQMKTLSMEPFFLFDVVCVNSPVTIMLQNVSKEVHLKKSNFKFDRAITFMSH